MPDGKTTGISERRKVARRLNDYSRSLLESVLSTVGEAIIAADSQGRIIMTNQAAADMWGHSVDELLAMNLLDLMPEEFRDAHDTGMKRYHANAAGDVRRSGIVNRRVELQGLHATKRIFPLEILISENAFGDQKIFTAALRDITKRKEQERALMRTSRLEVVEHLSGGIAHNFNNLLSVIRGNAVFLKSAINEPSEEVNGFFEDLLSAVCDCTELTDRLIAFSRCDILEPEIVEINSLIEKNVLFLSEQMGCTIALTAEAGKDEVYIAIDPRQFLNALAHLLFNARDAMPNGGNVVVKVERQFSQDCCEYDFYCSDALSDDEVYVIVSVSDSGEGMDEDVMRQVFEPFFTTKDIGQGNGLGLSMVHGFTAQSNGHCFIKSKPGSGTTVAMFFPEAESVYDSTTNSQQLDGSR